MNQSATREFWMVGPLLPLAVSLSLALSPGAPVTAHPAARPAPPAYSVAAEYRTPRDCLAALVSTAVLPTAVLPTAVLPVAEEDAPPSPRHRPRARPLPDERERAGRRARPAPRDEQPNGPVGCPDRQQKLELIV